MHFHYSTLIFALCVTVTLSAPKSLTVSKEDLKYIGCQVCEDMVGALTSALDFLKEVKPTHTVDELEVLSAIEDICRPNTQVGGWIRTLDIIESTSEGLSYLKLDSPGGYSKCGDECATIAKSCEMLLENEIDVDDLAVAMIKKGSASAKDMQNKVCHNMSSRCKRAAPHVDPKYKRINKPFKELTEKELEMENLMAEMQRKGMNANMYGRDDLDDMMASGDMGGMGGMGGMPDMDDYEGDDFEGMDPSARYGGEDDMLFNGGAGAKGFKGAKDAGYEL